MTRAPGPAVGREAASPEEGVLRFGTGMTRPPPLAEGEIVYTPEATAARVSGTSVVRCIITRDGAVKACRVVRSVPLMDDAIVNALLNHHGAPVTLDGRAIDADYTYTIRLRVPRDFVDALLGDVRAAARWPSCSARGSAHARGDRRRDVRSPAARRVTAL